MDKAELAQAVRQVAELHGTFRLRSGQTSDVYFDKYRFEARPDLLAEFARHMAELVPAGTEVLAGLELGGVPLATALSLHTGLPTAFVRKRAKDYGTCRLAEGSDIAGRKVCIVEDVITTGGQVIESAAELRTQGAEIDTVVCAILRAAAVPADLRATGLDVRAVLIRADLDAATAPA